MACIKRLKNSVPIAFLLVGLCFSFSSSHAQVVTQDSLALVALYNFTDGPNWTNNSGWLTKPVSTWEGVTVTGSRVTDLYLNSHNLVGSIPPELGDLSNLSFLDLWNNQLRKEIPSELGNLITLAYLDFGGNQLTGEIPSDLGYFKSLQG